MLPHKHNSETQIGSEDGIDYADCHHLLDACSMSNRLGKGEDSIEGSATERNLLPLWKYLDKYLCPKPQNSHHHLDVM
ncbi:hypothetical protein TNCV_4264471 [Trichonephila clavipes]|nr:hypothetical protein TNCV_4264471 [Trichonephila clavipes]